jgi:DNA processing protein
MLAKGRTVAFLGCGLSANYLQENASLRRAITRYGAVVSEYSPFLMPSKASFPIRNRLISGVSLGIVVVEAGVKSGSLITANRAAEQGKDVFAVPGRISDPNSFGCNYLISKNVAAIYSSALTLPTALGWSGDAGLEPGLQPQLFSFDVENKEKILLTLKFDTTTDVEKICALTGLDWGAVSSLLLELELEGKVVSKGSSEYYLKR